MGEQSAFHADVTSSSLVFSTMVLGAAWSGRLPVTEYNQPGSNPDETAIRVYRLCLIRS